MARRREPRVMTLEVQSMFEHSHLAEECLAQAYERLVPIVSRLIPATTTSEPASQPRPKRHAGGKQS